MNIYGDPWLAVSIGGFSGTLNLRETTVSKLICKDDAWIFFNSSVKPLM